MRFPMVPELLNQLPRKPITNPFPAAHLPETVTGFLAQVQGGQAAVQPPVPVPPRMRGKIRYTKPACIGCTLCVKVCPAHAIEMIPEEKKIRIFVGQCISCAQCTEVCPKNCLEMTEEFLIADTDRYSQNLVLG